MAVRRSKIDKNIQAVESLLDKYGQLGSRKFSLSCALYHWLYGHLVCWTYGN